MLVSTIIPVFNGMPDLVHSVHSALTQTHSDHEIIVVDDGSSDSGIDHLPSSPKIRVLRQKNRGTAAARNTGLDAARGDAIAFLDQDDFWQPRKLELQVRCLEANPQTDFVHGGAAIVDATGALLSTYIPPIDTSLREVVAWCDILVQTVLVRRCTVESVGGFDEALSGADDWDYWIRCAANGSVMVGLQEVLTMITSHDSNQSHRLDVMYERVMNTIDKHAQIDPLATLAARRKARRDFYGRMRSVAARQSGRQRWQSNVRALRINPAALLETPRYYLRQTKLKP